MWAAIRPFVLSVRRHDLSGAVNSNQGPGTIRATVALFKKCDRRQGEKSISKTCYRRPASPTSWQKKRHTVGPIDVLFAIGATSCRFWRSGRRQHLSRFRRMGQNVLPSPGRKSDPKRPTVGKREKGPPKTCYRRPASPTSWQKKTAYRRPD